MNIITPVVTCSASLARFSAKHVVLALPHVFSGKEVQRAQCSIEIFTKCTVNKRRTRLSLKALDIPYRFWLTRCDKRENHPFLKPSPAGQIAGPPSQHPTSDFWKSSDFLVVATRQVHQSLSTSQRRCLLIAPYLYDTYFRA